MKALAISLAFVSIGCIVALAWVLGTPAPIDPRVARLEADLKEARQTIAQLRRDLAERAKSLPSPSTVTSAASGVTLSTDTASAPTSGSGFAALPSSGTQGPAGLRELLKDPGMRAMMEQQQAVQIETSYARLFDQLQLTDEEKAHFKKLLADRQKAETDLALKLLDKNLTPEERTKIMAQAEQNKKTYDNAIKTFLNNDSDWKGFQSWESAKPERTMYDSVGRGLFASSSEPLSPDQERIIMEGMKQIRESPTPEQIALVNAIQDPSQINDGNIQRMLEMTDQNNQRTMQLLSQSLTPGQLKTLGNYLQQIRSLKESELKMGSMVINGGR